MSRYKRLPLGATRRWPSADTTGPAKQDIIYALFQRRKGADRLLDLGEWLSRQDDEAIAAIVSAEMKK